MAEGTVSDLEGRIPPAGFSRPGSRCRRGCGRRCRAWPAGGRRCRPGACSCGSASRRARSSRLGDDLAVAAVVGIAPAHGRPRRPALPARRTRPGAPARGRARSSERPISLPTMPPTTAPASVLATLPPPLPNWLPMMPPAMAPTTVPPVLVVRRSRQAAANAASDCASSARIFMPISRLGAPSCAAQPALSRTVARRT